MTIKVGDKVIDTNGHKGIVVKIIKHNPKRPIEEHGTVYVWQLDRINYGADNCEHYAHFEWRSTLRVLKSK